VNDERYEDPESLTCANMVALSDYVTASWPDALSQTVRSTIVRLHRDLWRYGDGLVVDSQDAAALTCTLCTWARWRMRPSSAFEHRCAVHRSCIGTFEYV
jgi:hypothetical protein